MKKILLLISIATFSFASAQDNGNPYLKLIPPKSKKAPFLIPNGTDTDTFFFRNSDILSQSSQFMPQAKLLYTLSNGNKVYALPQDHMPCVVPDMSQYNSMALVKPDIQQYNIPNPAYPPQNKVDPISPEKLKELQELLNKMSKNTN
jgi:hypothetical protein